MEKINIGKIGAISIVGMIFLSGLMVLPTTVKGDTGIPDIAVCNVGVVYPVIEGEDLLCTVYLKNIGTAAVTDGFWIKIHYSTTVGFWQPVDETIWTWVEPPILPGVRRGIEFTTTARSSYSTNFEVIADATEILNEMNKQNNYKHVCGLAAEIEPGTTLGIPVFINNVRSDVYETFIIEADEAYLPTGWNIIGGVPPSTITAAPSSNILKIEKITPDSDTVLNPVLRFNATRMSDGETQSIYFKIITTPTIGFSFSPFLNEFAVWGVDQAESDVTITSELISKKGVVTIFKHTVENTHGQYISAKIWMVNSHNMNMYKVLEMDINGEIIVPGNNHVLTAYQIKNGQLTHFYQNIQLYPNIKLETIYDYEQGLTTIIGTTTNNTQVTIYTGFKALGIGIENRNLEVGTLDTSDTSKPLCKNDLCAIAGNADCNMLLQ